MALNDDEVAKQIQHMVAFIKSEATEKCQEIEAKANEEFSIEKGRLVQQEKLKITQMYERKEKQIDVKKRIAYSNELNIARLRTLKARDEHIKKILAEAQVALGNVANDPAKYKKLMQDLLCQALSQLLEDEVVVRCRATDVGLVQSVTAAAAASYSALVKGKTVKITVDASNPLPSTNSGGLIVSTVDGKIMVENTLEDRLQLVATQLLPELRTILFGKSKTRVFYD